jgi:hypothetical protein
VLEVGSGGNPYFRSNVLCDAYVDTRQRHFAPLICDRPICLAHVERLPFKDDTFDFVIASHVLEHSEAPDHFLNELQRVGRAGYIESPDAFTERLTCYLDHRLEITERDGRLIIRKKENYVQDQAIRDLFAEKVSSVFPKLVRKHPFHFHVRHYWEKDAGGIRYEIVNPEYKLAWKPPETEHKNLRKTSLISLMKRWSLKFIRKIFSQNKKNRNLRIEDLCFCRACGNDSLTSTADKIVCEKCGRPFPITNGLIDFREL